MSTAAEYASMPVRISRDGVFIGDEKIPGCIVSGGVTVTAGGEDGNRMTVEFIVGPVECTDPWIDTKAVDRPAETATRYSYTGAKD